MTDGRLPFTEGVGRRSLAALLMFAMAFALSPLAAQAEGRLNMTVLEGANNVAAALSWSKLTYTTANDAIIGRDDLSPDNLSSGLVQGLLAAPLLLTGSSALNADVKAELTRLGVKTVHILGGTGAISSSVESALRADGYSVRRYSGKSRIETAVAVAEQFGGSAATGFLSRAFGSGSDETGTWADALGGGAWSAQSGWPVLLSQSDTLTPATRTYIQGSRLRKIIILGGTSAISAAAEAQVQALGVTTERVSGANRFATATAIATKRGFASAAAPTTIVLADGQNTNAWAAGFAAAGYAASGKPIVLSNAGALPTETDSWFAGGTSAKNLIVAPYVVEAASTAAANKLSLLKKAAVTLDATSFANNANITGKVFPKDDVTSSSVSGPCVATTTLTLAASTGAFSVPITGNFAPGSCALTFTTTYSNSSTQTDPLTVTIVGPGPTATVTDGPELTNVVVNNSTDKHVVLKYTFDEAVTLIDTTPFTKFKLYAFNSATFAPDAPPASAPFARPDPSDNKSILVSFLKTNYARSTTATVMTGAVKDFDQKENPPGARGVQAVSYAAARTIRPDLVSVTLAPFNNANTGEADAWVVRATFKFDEPATMTSGGFALYKLVDVGGVSRAAVRLLDGNGVSTGDGTDTHVMEYKTTVPGNFADSAAAQAYIDSIRYGWVDIANPGPPTEAVKNSEGLANLSHTVAINGGALTSNKHLLSIEPIPTANKVKFTFNVSVTTILNTTNFFVINHAGDVIDSSNSWAVQTGTVIEVPFATGKIDGQITMGGVRSEALDGGGTFHTREASSGAHTYATGTTLAPDLLKVIRAPSAQDPFGGAATQYKVTYRFNKNLDSTLAIVEDNLLGYKSDGTSSTLNVGVACVYGVIKTDIVCTVDDDDPPTFSAVADGVLFAVKAGTVRSADVSILTYLNYETSKIPSAS